MAPRPSRRYDRRRLAERTRALLTTEPTTTTATPLPPVVDDATWQAALDELRVIDFITSLDGYGAADGWPGYWGIQGPEYLAWLAEQPEVDSTALMGANTYRLMSGFVADGEPGTDQLAALSKVVFSSTLTEPSSGPTPGSSTTMRWRPCGR